MGKDSIFFKGLGTGSLSLAMLQHKLDLNFFFSPPPPSFYSFPSVCHVGPGRTGKFM